MPEKRKYEGRIHVERSLALAVLMTGFLLAPGTVVSAQASPRAEAVAGRWRLQVAPGRDWYASTRFLFVFKGSPESALACWLETPDGNYVETIYVTRKGGRKAFYAAPSAGRPEALPVWYHRAAGEPATDAVSAATSSSGLSLSRVAGTRLEPGRYVAFLEVNRSYDYNETWTRANSGVNGQPSVVYRAEITVSRGQAASSSFEAVGTGSVDGSDGRVRPGLEGITTALTLIQHAEIRFDAD